MLSNIVAQDGESGGKSEVLEDAVLLPTLGDLRQQIRRETSKFSSLSRARVPNRRERRGILENQRATLSRRRRRASRSLPEALFRTAQANREELHSDGPQKPT